MRQLQKICIIVGVLCLAGCGKQSSDLAEDKSKSEADASNLPVFTPEDVTDDAVEPLASLAPEAVLYDRQVIDLVLSGDIMPINNNSELDLDGDGSLDHIVFVASQADDYGYYYECNLTINNLEYSIGRIMLDMAADEEPLTLLTPDGIQVGIALNAYDNSYNAQTWIYLYDGEKIEEISLWAKPVYYDAEQNCLIADTLVDQIQWQVTQRAYRLEMSDEGEYMFRQLPGYSEYVAYDYESGEIKDFQVIQEIEGYADCDIRADRLAIPSNTAFTVLGGDAEEWIQVRVKETDTICWLHVRGGYFIQEDSSETEVTEFIGNIDVVN